jgi:hypothetical protein
MFPRGDGSSVNRFGRVAWAHDRQSNPNLIATFIGRGLAATSPE